jgi:hypothetical protein
VRHLCECALQLCTPCSTPQDFYSCHHLRRTQVTALRACVEFSNLERFFVLHILTTVTCHVVGAVVAAVGARTTAYDVVTLTVVLRPRLCMFLCLLTVRALLGRRPAGVAAAASVRRSSGLPSTSPIQSKPESAMLPPGLDNTAGVFASVSSPATAQHRHLCRQRSYQRV